MRLIEALLLWEGAVSNERLRELLGCTSVHASRLLSSFRQVYPRQIIRSQGDVLGEYIAGVSIKPILTTGDPDEYVSLTRNAPTAYVTTVQTNYSEFEPALFGHLHRAAVVGTGVIVAYQTLDRPAAAERLIFPHQVVEIAQRWHTRAWDSQSETFDDFYLGQIVKCRPSETASPVIGDDDTGWNTEVEIGIRSHDDLGYEKASVVEHEYFKGTVGRRIRTRGCLVRHVLDAMKVAVDPVTQKPPVYLLQTRDSKPLEPWLSTRAV